MQPFWALPEVSSLVWQILRRHLVVFQKTWQTTLMFSFVEPLLYLAAMGFGFSAFISEINGLSYLQFFAPGLIASSAMWATASECTYASYTRLRYQKIYFALAATPLSIDEIIVGDILYGTFKSITYGSIVLFVISLFGLVSSPWALLVPGVMVLCGLIFAMLGIIWTSLVPSMEAFNYFFTLAITPMFLFSGIFFPLETFPPWVQEIAWFTPLYHVVELTRNLVLGRLSSRLFIHFLWLVIATLLLVKFPLVLMRRRLVK